jgi:transposase
MSGVPKVEIAESVETLKSLMKQQKTALNYAKVQSLYLLKINVAETVRYLAVIMGRSESTIHYWLQLYKTGGIAKLLEEPPQTGRPKKNAPVHTAHKLIVPENVILLFQPPYCPELNPIERVWQYLKQQLKNLFFTSIDEVKVKVAKILTS